MTMRKVAQRIPFTPSKTQAALLERCFGDRRFAYNQQVEAFNTHDSANQYKTSSSRRERNKHYPKIVF